MQSFTDAEGREWFLDFNIATVRRYRVEMAKDVKLKEFDFLDYAGILAAINDVFFAADLLYLVCREQTDERKLTAWDFGRALKGKILFDAIAAFVESVSPEIPLHVTRFFPRFRMMDSPPTPVVTIRRLAAIAGRRLRHVLAGNV